MVCHNKQNFSRATVNISIIDYQESSRLLTIEDELKILPVPVDMKESVYMMHMPPANTGLDVCRYGERVGSIAIYQFLQAYQPKYALHGHIHESPDVSGVWQSQIGKTICVQPGQMTRYTYVIIDCLTNTVDRYED